MPEVAVVIPAGGVGSRFGARTPKQFLRLGTMPILAATVRHFARHPAVRAVVVAAPEPWVARAGRILGRVVTRITIAGALFLGIVAVMPTLIGDLTGVQTLRLGGTSILIVVGVVVETMKQLEAQLLQRSYEGFIR